MAGIYIHIPFCKQACSYCNFHFSTNKKMLPQVVVQIANEAILRKEYFSETVDTIYFGGGTPSIMSIEQIQFVLATLQNNFDVSKNAEITLEANPDDITEQNLMHWKNTGINRLSLGIQSFIDEELLWMNRSHNAASAVNAIHSIKKHFENYSIDLIFGSQLLTNEDWIKNISTALSFNPPHISCYALTIEEKTLLGNKVAKKVVNNIDNNKQAEQFEILMQMLVNAGYNHYEISNYALPNFESKHNSSYWQGKHYLGLGPSAHSYNGTTRSWNVANNALYVKQLEHNILALETEILTDTQQLNEYIMISLRTSKGIDAVYLREKFGNDTLLQFENKVTTFIESK